MSTSDGAVLPVWRNCENLNCFEVIRFDKGDAVLFRWDVFHAGAPYESGHSFRLHAYLESSTILHDHNAVVHVDMNVDGYEAMQDMVKDACFSAASNQM